MDDNYLAAPDRYQRQPYRAAGRHGLRLPGIGLGLWHNFGAGSDPATAKAMVHQAFDLGITHFDLANNYGPPPGSAELTFGTLLKRSLAPYRDELIIASKAGYVMWDGPYGDGGSAKYLFASLHQSLRRLGLDYVDIFYHHRPDPRTPLEETCQALALMVRQGKALYIGLSNYPAPLAAKAAARLAELGTPCLVNQLKYSLFQRDVEPDTLPACREHGMGVVAFSPLAGGAAERSLPGGHSRGFPRRQCQPLPHGGPDHRGEARHRPRPACTGPATGSVPVATRTAMGAARPRGELRPDRRQPSPTDNERRRRPGAAPPGR